MDLSGGLATMTITMKAIPITMVRIMKRGAQNRGMVVFLVLVGQCELEDISEPIEVLEQVIF
jgi:hypothetical protein